MDKTDRLRDYGLAFLLYEQGLGVCGYELIRELFIFVKLILNSYLEKYLDKGNGECFFNNLECRNIVAQALLHFDNVRYKIVSYVIMPNHVHVVLMPYGEWMVQDIIKSIKHYSALRINRLLGRVGQVWQKESFDRIIRDEQHYKNILKYIYNNPRNLTKDTFSLYFAENLI